MTYRTIEEHAAARGATWLAKHGAHEWEQHDLVAEAMEEATDGWVYTRKAIEFGDCPEVNNNLEIAAQAFAIAWAELRSYVNTRTAILAHRGNKLWRGG